MHDIITHNNLGCTEIECALLFSTEGLKQSELTTRTRRHISNLNNGKYIDRRSNSVTTDQNVIDDLKKTRILIVYLQLKFDEIQNDYLTQALVFLARVDLKKKNKLLLEKIELTHLF